MFESLLAGFAGEGPLRPMGHQVLQVQVARLLEAPLAGKRFLFRVGNLVSFKVGCSLVLLIALSGTTGSYSLGYWLLLSLRYWHLLSQVLALTTKGTGSYSLRYCFLLSQVLALAL